MTSRFAGIFVVGLGLSICGCGGGGPDLPQAENMTKVDGDGQRATAGNRLSVPLTVLVTDPGAKPIPRGEVRWEVTQGIGATLSDMITVSDGAGGGKVFLTLGPTPGNYSVRATLVRKPSITVSFSATAVSPPTLSSVAPTFFGPGDTIVLQGTFLTDSVVLDIAGVIAEILGVSVIAGGLSAVVPPCLSAGPVAITARVGLARSNSLSATYQTSTVPLRLDVGEYVSVPAGLLLGCARFPDAGPGGAEYLLVPNAAGSNASATFSYQLNGDSAGSPVPVSLSVPSPPTSSSRFHDFLRAREKDLVGILREVPQASSAATSIELGISVGDTKKFRICDKIKCRPVEDFPEVQAEVKYVGERAVIYQDKDAPAGGFSAQEFQELGRLFDEDLYDVGTRAFGAESDRDENGRVLILLSPKVNALTARAECENSIVTGFFFALDIDPAANKDPRSNKAEIFYSIVPDPSGTVTCEMSKDRVGRLVPVTFVHEFQHMISFYQHVLLRGGNTEATWLNEAMSHLAEELGARHFQALGDQTRFSSFAIGDLLNAFKYMKAPGMVSPIFASGTGTLEERGASWLFIRWVADQFGPDVIRRLSETSRTGQENVAAATGEPVPGLLSDWILANFVSDLPGLSVPARLQYESWKLREVYESLNDQSPNLFDLPYPIVPMVFSAGSFSVSGAIVGGSGEYFLIQQGAGQRGFGVRLTNGPLLNILRIR